MSSSISRFMLFIALCLTLYSGRAHAYVECAVNPYRYYVGDSILWVMWREGGAGVVYQNSPDFKPIFASVLTAVASSRPMIVRYADGVTCTSAPATIVGMWLL
jgi:hypothetical protein